MARAPRIGALRHDAEVQQRTLEDRTDPAYPGWETRLRTRVSLAPARARSFLVPEAGEIEEVTHFSFMRYPTDIGIKAGDRVILDEDDVYSVVSVADFNDRGRWLDMRLKEEPE